MHRTRGVRRWESVLCKHPRFGGIAGHASTVRNRARKITVNSHDDDDVQLLYRLTWVTYGKGLRHALMLHE